MIMMMGLSNTSKTIIKCWVVASGLDFCDCMCRLEVHLFYNYLLMFEIYEDNAGQYRWRIIASNGQNV